MDIVKGRVVKSKAGHDKDTFAVVVDINTEEILICDGKHHKIENPKRKNPKHVVATNKVVELPQTDKQIRRILNALTDID